MRPGDRKYSETHEWVKISGKEAVIGITDYAVAQLSDLVHIELPKVGDDIEQGAPFGEIESVKTVAELISPVSGKIKEVHAELADNLDILTDDPLGEGWIVKIQMSNVSETDSLMKAKEYEDFIKASEAEGGKGGGDDDDVDEEDFV